MSTNTCPYILQTQSIDIGLLSVAKRYANVLLCSILLQPCVVFLAALKTYGNEEPCKSRKTNRALIDLVSQPLIMEGLPHSSLA